MEEPQKGLLVYTGMYTILYTSMYTIIDLFPYGREGQVGQRIVVPDDDPHYLRIIMILILNMVRVDDTT